MQVSVQLCTFALNFQKSSYKWRRFSNRTPICTRTCAQPSCTIIAKRQNGIGGADFLLLQSADRSPYAVKRVWHNHFHPLPAPSALQLRQCRQVHTPVHTKSAVTYTAETYDNQRSADTLCKMQAKRCKTSDACAREHLLSHICTQAWDFG